MAITRFNPPDGPKPASNYSQGVTHPGGGRRLIVAGQVGVRPDGSLAPTLQEQVDLAVANFLTVVRAAGMGPANVTKITVYGLSPEAVPLSRAARDRAFEGHAPASTYVQVAGLAGPGFLFEIDGEAWADA
jgi:enamine deaminase RidA (YjgF/YER057c/UK114 family)